MSGLAIAVTAQLVDQQFGHILDHGKSPAHVAVEGAVTGGVFALVAGGEYHRSEFVRHRHQDITADACLDIFLGDVRRCVAEEWLKALQIGFIKAGDRHFVKFDAEILRQLAGIFPALLTRKLAGHGDAGDVFLSQRIRRHRAHQGGIHPSG